MKEAGSQVTNMSGRFFLMANSFIFWNGGLMVLVSLLHADEVAREMFYQ